MDKISAAQFLKDLVQFAPLLTAVAAIMALRSWRPNTLGQRTIALAEDCLTKAWRLNDSIRKYRQPYVFGLSFFPGGPSDDANVVAQRSSGIQACELHFSKCIQNLEEFKEAFRLVEFYLGYMPRVPFHNIKIGFEIPDEYGQIAGTLRMNFLRACELFSPETSESPEKSKEARVALDKYVGFSLSERTISALPDEVDERLSQITRLLERRIRDVLRRRIVWNRLSDLIEDSARRSFRKKRERRRARVSLDS